MEKKKQTGSDRPNPARLTRDLESLLKHRQSLETAIRELKDYRQAMQRFVGRPPAVSPPPGPAR